MRITHEDEACAPQFPINIRASPPSLYLCKRSKTSRCPHLHGVFIETGDIIASKQT